MLANAILATWALMVSVYVPGTGWMMLVEPGFTSRTECEAALRLEERELTSVLPEDVELRFDCSPVRSYEI